MKTIVSNAKDIAAEAAERIRALLKRKPDAVIALTAGHSTAILYAVLSRMREEGEVSFQKARLFAVTEYVGVEYGHSCRAVLERELINNIDVEPANVFYPDPDDCEGYDRLIERAGGLDLAVLGIGLNGHIGYNEPATPFDSRTHVQKLTDATKRQLIASGSAPETLAERAVTMGIKTIIEARDIILLAFGREKAAAVFEMVYGKTITYVPASFLQIPLCTAVYLDEAAAEKL